jgi:elongation factor G
LAEAKALRAYAYLQLQSYFTTDMKDDNALGVILTTSVPKPNDQLPRVKNVEIYSLIESDLDFAYNNLKEGNNYKYVTKNLINAIRARMYTYRGKYQLAAQYAQAVEPKTKADQDKMGNALAKLAEEDPTFTVKTDEASGQTIISGMGELHLDIIVDRMRREFKVEVNQGQPQVEYKEALTQVANHREVYKKQSGGRGKFADIVFEIGPADEGKTGLEFINEIKGGNIPREFIPSVEKGFKESMKNGPLAGFEVESMKVTLKDGSFHAVDSDQLSFELAAKMGFKASGKAAKAVIMEPIMKLEVVTPEEYMGDIVGDLNRRRGTVNGMDDRNNAKVIKAFVPLSEMFGYVTSLRTLSSGRATSSMEFERYEPAPTNIAEEVIAKARG